MCRCAIVKIRNDQDDVVNDSPCDEDVLGLDISVQDFSFVDVLHGSAELSEVGEDDGFGNEAAAPAGYLGKEIAALAVLHCDVECPEIMPYSLPRCQRKVFIWPSEKAL